MRTAQEIATELGGARKEGNGWKCRCPLHDDTHGSLHISQAEDGGFLAHCFAGCPDKDVWQAVRDRCRLNGERLSSSPKPKFGQNGQSGQRAYLPPREPDPVDLKLNGQTPVADWRYRSATGVLLFVVARYEVNGRKTIRPWTWDGAKWIAKAMDAPRPLYGLDKLAKRPEAPVILVEGEKTAEAARRLFPEHVAVTWPGGADGVRHCDFSPLKGRRVLLLPDADEPGRRAMGDAAARLKTIAATITVLSPPDDVPAGWDVADADWTPEQAAAWLREQLVGNGAPSPMEWTSLARKTAPAREWLIDGWLGRGHPTLLAGPGGSGKSLIAQQAASCLSIGAPFIGQQSAPLRVLMWMCEDDHDELWRRQVAISHWLGRPLTDFSNLVIVPRLGQDNTLLSVEFGRPIWTPLIKELREQCRDYRADVWFGDNLGHLFGANENSRHDVTMFVGGVTECCGAATPVFIGHPSKSAGSEFSGSTAWENAMRMRWWFSTKMPDDQSQPDGDADDADTDVRYLCKRKTNYSVKDYAQFRFESGVFQPMEGNSIEPDPVIYLQAERLIIHAIDKLNAMGINSSEKHASNYLPKLMAQYGLNEGVPKYILARTLARLMIEGKVIKAAFGKDNARRNTFGLKTA